MKKLSRRNFLKFGGATLAGAAVGLTPLGQMAVMAQDGELSLQTWGHFISSSNDLLTSLVNSWSAANGSSVDINYTGFGQLADTLSTAAATGAGPDLIMMLHARPHQFSEALLDVSDVVTEVGEANGGWYGIAEEACMVDGVWRAMPWFLAAHAMVYREDLFAEAGYDTFPDTWEGLLEAGTALKGMGAPLGFSVGRADGDGNNFCYSLLWSFGGAVTDTDDNIVLDSPETRAALEFVQQLYNDAMVDSVTTWDDGANNRAFLAGEVSCTNNASSVLWAGRRDGIEFMASTNHASYPAGPAGLVQFSQVHSIGVLNYAANPDAAKDLLRYINSPQVWQSMGLNTFAFNYPLFHNYEDDPSMPWNFDPALGAFRGLPETGHTMGYPGNPSAAASEVASSFVITDMFGSVCAGVASIDEAIGTAIEQIQDIYSA